MERDEDRLQATGIKNEVWKNRRPCSVPQNSVVYLIEHSTATTGRRRRPRSVLNCMSIQSPKNRRHKLRGNCSSGWLYVRVAEFGITDLYTWSSRVCPPPLQCCYFNYVLCFWSYVDSCLVADTYRLASKRKHLLSVPRSVRGRSATNHCEFETVHVRLHVMSRCKPKRM